MHHRPYPDGFGFTTLFPACGSLYNCQDLSDVALYACQGCCCHPVSQFDLSHPCFHRIRRHVVGRNRHPRHADDIVGAREPRLRNSGSQQKAAFHARIIPKLSAHAPAAVQAVHHEGDRAVACQVATNNVTFLYRDSALASATRSSVVCHQSRIRRRRLSRCVGSGRNSRFARLIVPTARWYFQSSWI